MIPIVRLAGLALGLFLLGGCSKSSEKPVPASEPEARAAGPSAAAVPAAPAPTPEPTGTPLTIAYSDWPGWVAWDIAVQKGWFKEAGVSVELKWFDDYVKSMEAYAAKQIDSVCVTNGDASVTGATDRAAPCGWRPGW